MILIKLIIINLIVHFIFHKSNKLNKIIAPKFLFSSLNKCKNIFMELEKRVELALVSKNETLISSLFNEIYEKYYRLVLFIVSNELKSKDDIFDITQDSFIILFNELLKEHKKINNLKYYLLTIVKNKIIEFKKEENKRVDIEDVISLKEININEKDDYSKNEYKMDEYLSILNETELDIIIKHIYLDQTFKEIVINSNNKFSSINTVKSIYRRSLEKLKKNLLKKENKKEGHENDK